MEDAKQGLKLGDLEVVPCRMVLGDVVQNHALDFKPVQPNQKMRHSTFNRYPDTPQAGVLVRFADQKASTEDAEEDPSNEDTSSDEEGEDAKSVDLTAEPSPANAKALGLTDKKAKKKPKQRITNKERLLIVVPGVEAPLRFNRKDVALFIPSWPILQENRFHEYHTADGAAAAAAASENDGSGTVDAPPKTMTQFKYYIVVDIRAMVRTKHAYAYQKKPVENPEKLAKYTERQTEAKEVINRLSEFTVPRSALRPATREALASSVGFASDAKRLMVLEGEIRPCLVSLGPCCIEVLWQDSHCRFLILRYARPRHQEWFGGAH